MTFIDPFLGLCGLSAVLIANFLARLLGFSAALIREGMYGFNALLLGMAMGYEYAFNEAFVFVFVATIILLLLISVSLGAFLGKYGLPYLSLPFIISYWLFYLAAGSFSLMQLQEQYVFFENYKVHAALSPFYNIGHSLDHLALPLLLKSYLTTLSSTFFQHSILGGILIAAALLYHSRISFSLSAIGFLGAYYCFRELGLDTNLLTTYLVGSNYVFFAIGVGALYVVPNRYSYLSVLLLLPVLTILYISFYKLLLPFQLKSFTLSFSVLSIVFLFFLKNRLLPRFIEVVSVQYYSAEKTIYKHLNSTKRFANRHLAKLQLPFWGEWQVSQGYEGEITHLGEWSAALDFVVVDIEGKTYQMPATECKDFYCYNKPIVAPADGFVYDIINNVEDNAIGELNLQENWGNTLILNHQNGLFSQLSHLKKDSFKVEIGQYVTKGTLLAACGSSGRSPEPHLHFQVQLSPVKGAKTHPYPIAYFITHQEGKRELKTFEVPQENSVVSNVTVAPLLQESYNYLPARQLKWTDTENGNEVVWKIFTDDLNRTYLHCAQTRSTVWFANDGVLFYCYDFEGDRNSLLFNFYLANYKILLGAYTDIKLTDEYPLLYFNNRFVLTLQDFFAPFFLFTKARYTAECVACDNPNHPTKVIIRTTAPAEIAQISLFHKHFELTFEDNALQTFSVLFRNKQKKYVCELS